MAKALKPLIIVLFLLSIAALGLGVMLFGQRDVLKGRVVKLQDGHANVAQSIKYTGLDRNALQDYDQMDTQIRTLNAAAKNLQDTFIATSNDLVATTTDLNSTRKELQVTQTELQSSQDEVAGLEETVAGKEQEIAAKGRTISTLEQDKEELTTRVEGLENDYTICQDDLREKEAQYASLEKAYEEEVRINTAASGSGGPDGPSVDFFGSVVISNPEWNFVVINGGSNDQLEDNMVFLVHRNTEPVGKIRLRKVEADVAIADVITEWDTSDLAVGDAVIPPKPAG